MAIKAKVFKDGGAVVDVEVKRNCAVLGRKLNSDIRVDSEHISRKHLEIKLEREKLFLKKASSQNWVLVNGVPLGDGHWIQCGEGDKIELPDGFHLALEKGDSFAISKKTVDFSVKPAGSLGKPSGFKRETGKRKVFQNKKNDLSKTLFGALIVGGAALGAFYHFDLGTSPISTKETLRQNPDKIKVVSSKTPTGKLEALSNEPQTQASRERIERHTAQIKRRPAPGRLCENKFEEIVCSLSGLNRSKGEGAKLMNESLYFFLDITSLEEILSEGSALKALQSSDEKSAMRFLCAYRAMRPAVVNESRVKKVKNIYCRFMKSGNVLKPSIAVEIENGINYRSTDHQAAFDFFESHISFELFENFFASYMLLID